MFCKIFTAHNVFEHSLLITERGRGLLGWASCAGRAQGRGLLGELRGAQTSVGACVGNSGGCWLLLGH